MSFHLFAFVRQATSDVEKQILDQALYLVSIHKPTLNEIFLEDDILIIMMLIMMMMITLKSNFILQ